MIKLSLTALLCVAVGCAASSSKTASVHSFDVQDEWLFDNGLDEVLAPSIVAGSSAGVFEQRVARADLIALVRIDSSASHVDFQQRTSYLLHTETLQRLRGQGPASMLLRVRDGQAGFDSVRRSEEELPGSPWVAFVKWPEGEQGSTELRPRWHLSPSSTRVLEKLAFLMRPAEAQTQTSVEYISR